ncbi:patatin-like phospholipase family protein [Seleniivibrio sp.]|uniref:patatin-like phospholipase family protein n=1 Tax=Seleniivibrio sp. TaxID=2898801 RepID=UPI0025CE5662|nr:patatin-like phospholipase family protein [Seleniivibrio sp.]MCD8554656.1 patatin-like phospholipase family protein [Seleniivibrio sp.]
MGILSDKKIGIALSGGGIRAIAFHAGVVQFLAENNLMRKITNISSVSGGSLFTGIVFHLSGNMWPTAPQFTEKILPRLRYLMTSTSLQQASMSALMKPSNWKNILYKRGIVIAQTIESLWGIDSVLADLPQTPVWTINGTNGENGQRFRFKNETMGDHRTGYASARMFKTAKAMAISAAFPIGIGPIEIDTSRYRWEKETFKGSGVKERVKPEYKKLHIYDGGLYDNLGTETFYKVGEQDVQLNTKDVDFVIISDAGSPFIETPLSDAFSLRRANKLIDILMEQSRILRVRSFMNFLRNNGNSGVYLSLSDSALLSYTSKGEDLTVSEVTAARQFPTSLDQMTGFEFDSLVKCGYQAAALNIEKYLNGN